MRRQNNRQRASAPQRKGRRRQSSPDRAPASARCVALNAAAPDGALEIRRVRASDIAHVIALDERVTGLAKPDYWQDLFELYGQRRPAERFFLVAESRAREAGLRILGFIIGEVRAWEFGSAPCGWVFALSVEPDTRLQRIGEALFEAISEEFKKAGVTKMRTMVARDNRLPLLFFRGQGMITGPFIQLEKELE